MYDRVKRNKRLNFSIQEVRKVENDKLKRKTEQMETKVLACVLHLVEQGGSFKSEQVLQHRVTPKKPLQCQWDNAKGSEKQVS